MKSKQLIFVALALAVLALVPTAAQADPLTFTLNNPFQSGSVGDILTFNATVTNTGSANAFIVTINGSTYSFPNPGDVNLTLDDTLFFTNFDGNTLGVGNSITADIFNVAIGPGTASGIYTGTFSILFDSQAGSQQVVTQDFTVTVGAVPEPASMMLLGTGLAGLAAGLCKRRRARTL